MDTVATFEQIINGMDVVPSTHIYPSNGDILMRNLILDEIENYRHACADFGKDTMRWNKWYFLAPIGFVFFNSNKERKSSNAKHISETTRDDFEMLNNENLLLCYRMITIQAAKQM